MAPDCPLCDPAQQRILLESEHTVALFDAFPVTEGHVLVVPRRHVASVWDLPDEEQAELWTLTGRVRRMLLDGRRTDGFNIGVNDGAAAGQTVAHAHIHVIPRRFGDAADPRGGLRWVIPEKAAYWGREA